MSTRTWRPPGYSRLTWGRAVHSAALRPSDRRTVRPSSAVSSPEASEAYSSPGQRRRADWSPAPEGPDFEVAGERRRHPVDVVRQGHPPAILSDFRQPFAFGANGVQGEIV